MKESNYWSKLRNAISQRIYCWKINASYERGVPDCWFSGVLQDLWVENKRVATAQPPPILDLTDDKKYLTALQQLWLERRHAEGRHIGVIVFSNVGHIWLPGLSWKEKISRLDFMEMAVTMPELADMVVEICGEIELK
jgi:hypothetical protein